MIYTTNYHSPVGEILLAESQGSLTGLWIESQIPCNGFSGTEIGKKETPVLIQTKNWLDRYFSGEKPEIRELSLSPAGSDFRQKVWKILCRIPYGTTMTYGDIAKEISGFSGTKKMSAQAVGGAVGHNPISIIIPCHRVIGVNGNLTGYAGGITLKIELLTHEGVDMTGMFYHAENAGKEMSLCKLE